MGSRPDVKHSVSCKSSVYVELVHFIVVQDPLGAVREKKIHLQIKIPLVYHDLPGFSFSGGFYHSGISPRSWICVCCGAFCFVLYNLQVNIHVRNAS